MIAEVEKYIAHYEEECREELISSSPQQQQNKSSNLPLTSAAATTSESVPTIAGSTPTSSASIFIAAVTGMETVQLNTTTNENNINTIPTYNPQQNSILKQVLSDNLLTNIL